MFLELLFILSIRFFLFDFYLFESLREKIKKKSNKKVKKLLSCPYCQGFWCGLITNISKVIFTNEVFDLFILVMITFASAILSFTWYMLILHNSKKV